MRARIRLLITTTATALVAAAVIPGVAGAQSVQEARFSGYATGTVYHTHVGEFGGTRLVDSEIAYSSAAVDTGGLEERASELGRLAVPATDGAISYGRGSAIEAGLNQPVPGDENQVVLAAKVEASAPPTSDPDPQEIGPVPADPAAYASTARGDAFAAWPQSLGGDFGYGLGYVEDAEAADLAGPDGEGDGESLEQPLLATNAGASGRAVSWSTSRTALAPQVDADGNVAGDRCGIVSEVRQTIAPVTLPDGTTIEVAGEWVLRAAAGGIPGTAHIHYGPGDVSPQTPLLRIISPPNEEGVREVTDILNTQDLFGEEGLVIPASPIANIVIGEDPRAIGDGPDSQPPVAADGTSAGAAVDVVRVELLSVEGTGELAEIRIGHMEVEAAMQPGGVDCAEVGIDKTADRGLVEPGDEFTYTIRVVNPNACILEQVRVADAISADEGIDWEVLSTDPQADTVEKATVVWNDIGPLAPGEARDLRIRIRVTEDSAAGRFHDTATVTGVCATQPVSGEDDAELGVPVDNQITVDLPEVATEEPAGVPRSLPTTGGSAWLTLAGLGLVGSAVAVRRRLW